MHENNTDTQDSAQTAMVQLWKLHSRDPLTVLHSQPNLSLIIIQLKIQESCYAQYCKYTNKTYRLG